MEINRVGQLGELLRASTALLVGKVNAIWDRSDLATK
jgi:hypothetical protein